MTDFIFETDVSLINNDQWREFVHGHPYGSIFQTPDFYQICLGTKNYQPLIVVCLSEKTRQILGVMVSVVQRDFSNLFSFMSARCIVWGGPLVHDNDNGIYELILNEHDKRVSKSVIYTQIRNLYPKDQMPILDRSTGYQYIPHLNIFIDLFPSEDEIWKGIHQKRRNEIRKAFKEQVTIKKLESKSEIDDVYSILFNVYKRVKMPIPDKSLFESAYQLLHSTNRITFYGAIYRDVLIGAMITLNYKDKVYDWYAGSLEQYYAQHPNDMIPWEVFMDAKRNGFFQFDFGGAGKPGLEYGVRNYKSKFGGKLVETGRYEKIYRKVLFKFAKIGFYIYFNTLYRIVKQ